MKMIVKITMALLFSLSHTDLVLSMEPSLPEYPSSDSSNNQEEELEKDGIEFNHKDGMKCLSDKVDNLDERLAIVERLLEIKGLQQGQDRLSVSDEPSDDDFSQEHSNEDVGSVNNALTSNGRWSWVRSLDVRNWDLQGMTSCFFATAEECFQPDRYCNDDNLEEQHVNQVLMTLDDVTVDAQEQDAAAVTSHIAIPNKEKFMKWAGSVLNSVEIQMLLRGAKFATVASILVAAWIACEAGCLASGTCSGFFSTLYTRLATTISLWSRELVAKSGKFFLCDEVNGLCAYVPENIIVFPE